MLSVAEGGPDGDGTSIDLVWEPLAPEDPEDGGAEGVEWFITQSSELSLNGDTVRRKLEQGSDVLIAEDCPEELG